MFMSLILKVFVNSCFLSMEGEFITQSRMIKAIKIRLYIRLYTHTFQFQRYHKFSYVY